MDQYEVEYPTSNSIRMRTIAQKLQNSTFLTIGEFYMRTEVLLLEKDFAKCPTVV